MGFFCTFFPLRHRERFAQLSLFLFFTTLYLMHLSPSVYGGDVGDFVTAAAVRGVPHPSGYPLFTLLGIVMTFIIPFGTVAFKVGIVSVLSGALGVVVVFNILKLLLKKTFFAYFGAIFLGVSYPYWHYAEIAEVFAFSYLLFLLVIYTALQFGFTESRRWFFFLAFAIGLSLSNHQFSVLLLPAVFCIILWKRKVLYKRPKDILIGIGLFLVAFLPYVYVPIASSMNPVLNWGHVTDLKSLLRLLLRLDYGWSPSEKASFSDRVIHLTSYMNYILMELSPVYLFGSIFGFLAFCRKNIWIGLFFILGFFLTGPFFIFYAGYKEIHLFSLEVFERFYVFSILFLVIAGTYGLADFCDLFLSSLKNVLRPSMMRLLTVSAAALFFLIPFFMLLQNSPKTDLHNLWLGDAIIEDMLSPLPQNSIAIVTGDSLVLNAFYVQHVNGFRKDILIDSAMEYLMRDPLYANEAIRITKDYPKISENDRYLLLLTTLAPQRPVFSSEKYDFDDQKAFGKIRWIPYGLLYKYIPPTEMPLTKEAFTKVQKKIWSPTYLFENKELPQAANYSFTMLELQSQYAYALTDTANVFVREYDDWDTAAIYLEKAAWNFPYAYESLAPLVAYYLSRNECRNAERILTRFIAYSPRLEQAYLLLNETYSRCSGSDGDKRAVRESYQKIFQKDIDAKQSPKK